MIVFELIRQLDSSLFLFINSHFSPFFDNFMFAVSNKLVWIPLYASVLYVLIRFWKKDALWLAIALILCIVICDQVASGVFKNLVHRLRPSHAQHLKGMVHLVRNYSAGKYGFASSHASNAFGFATLSALILHRKLYSYFIFGWASMTAYSRIYLGLHYPLDIVGGIIIGVLAAVLCFWMLEKLKPEIFETNVTDTKVPIYVLLISLACMLVYGFCC